MKSTQSFEDSRRLSEQLTRLFEGSRGPFDRLRRLIDRVRGQLIGLQARLIVLGVSAGSIKFEALGEFLKGLESYL